MHQPVEVRSLWELWQELDHHCRLGQKAYLDGSHAHAAAAAMEVVRLGGEIHRKTWQRSGR